ncbi:hypothetical protein B0H14DRAFT_3725052 [Mycena olivaceomarginata]|nr:hypothetical protein B0H14DRAFT_3725052 [Mycena olivaceomarginata]
MFAPHFLIFVVLIPVWASPTAKKPRLSSKHSFKPAATQPSFQSQVIYQSPTSLFFENIAVRASSDLLLTSVASPTLYTLDPSTINGTLNALHTFPNAASLTGIAEYRPDVFALASSVVNVTTRRAVPDSTVIWSIDFTSNAQSPVVRALARLPGATSANGLSAIHGLPDILLAADSDAGAVWQIDASTGTTRLVVQDASMLANAPPPALGINGLHIAPAAPELLYFANSGQGTISRLTLQIDKGNAIVSPAGAVQTLASIQPAGAQQAPDDFALDPAGRGAWVAVHPGALVLLSPPSPGNANGNWTQVTAVGNSQGSDKGMMQPTSAAIGRGKQVGSLFVTTGVGQVVMVASENF